MELVGPYIGRRINQISDYQPYNADPFGAGCYMCRYMERTEGKAQMKNGRKRRQ